MSETALPGVTLDPKDEAGLESAFGVTSNAEELIKQNRQRYTPEQRAALAKPVNDELSGRVQEHEDYDPEKSQYGLAAGPVEAGLEDHLGFPVEAAVVRGSGGAATISYVFVDDRGSLEKGSVPFTDVFGTEASRDAAKRKSERKPDEEAQAAADAKLDEADSEASAKIKAAVEDAQAELAKARERAAELIAKAEEDARQIREKAAEEAPKAAEKAADDAKQQAARSGSSGSSRKGGSRSGKGGGSRSKS